MTNLTGKLAVALALAVIAMPATAYAQFGGGVPRGGGGGQAAAPIQRSAPAMHSFAPHVGGRAFTPHVGGRTFTSHTRSGTFTPHVGRSANFSRQHRVTTFNRSVQRTQRLHGVTQPNTATRTLRSTTGVRAHALRRNGSAAITAQAARQGRFGSRFAGRTGNRFANVAAHRAWRRGLRAGFVPWYGPVFWPYAYSDIFDYAFWPYGYDDGFWDYAYDDFVDGLFWGQDGPPADYAYAAPASPRVSYAGVQELCKQPGTGITAWPFAEIQRKVGLNDEQKERFNALGPKRVANNAETAAALPQDSKSCSEAKPGLANLPIEKIEDVVKPTGAQEDGLKQLQDATGKAVSLLQAACPEDTPLTPPGRLTAMEKRLQAMIDAANTVRPALDSFYASLSNEQKARFDRIGQQLAQTGG
jgi:hypothetical protein